MASPPEKSASPLAVAKAVFWSFLGIRKKKDYQSDVVRITPLQAIIGGLIGAAIFVAALVTLVHYITSR